MACSLAARHALVRLWPRRTTHCTGSGQTGPAPGVAALSAGHLAVLVAAAVLLNDQYLFFSDWRDLSGALSGTGPTLETAVAGGPTGRQGPAPPVHVGETVGPASSGVLLSTSGRVRRYRVVGGASGITADVYVDVPPGADALPAGRRLPVLETFAGYPADPRQWLGAMDLPPTLDAQVASGALVQPLVVLPTVEVPAGTDTECTDTGRRGSDVETWLASDVPAWLTSTFPVAATRDGWATMGLSAGGFCAAMLAMHHPDAYSAGISFGGYYRAELPSALAAGRSEAQLVAYDLVAQARTAPPAVSLWVMTSTTDAPSFRSTEALLHAARPPLSVHADTLLDAGHRTSVYSGLVAPALRWLAGVAPGFKPPGAASGRPGCVVHVRRERGPRSRGRLVVVSGASAAGSVCCGWPRRAGGAWSPARAPPTARHSHRSPLSRTHRRRWAAAGRPGRTAGTPEDRRRRRSPAAARAPLRARRRTTPATASTRSSGQRSALRQDPRRPVRSAVRQHRHRSQRRAGMRSRRRSP